MCFGFCSVTLNNVECLKGSVIFNSLNWRPVFQVWFKIQNRAYAVLTNLKQPPQFTSCPCHMHRWAGLGVLLIKALTLGSRMMYQLQWTVVVTTAEGKSVVHDCQSRHCTVFLPFSLCPWQGSQPRLKQAAREGGASCRQGSQWDITRSTHLAAYSAEWSRMFQMTTSANRIFF